MHGRGSVHLLGRSPLPRFSLRCTKTQSLDPAEGAAAPAEPAGGQACGSPASSQRWKPHRPSQRVFSWTEPIALGRVTSRRDGGNVFYNSDKKTYVLDIRQKNNQITEKRDARVPLQSTFLQMQSRQFRVGTKIKYE